MRTIEIQLDGEPLIPGGKIEGHVIVKCDKDFHCERVHIAFQGIELARVVIHAGKATIVHEEKRVHIDETKELASCIIVPQGETRCDFSFVMPLDIPGSYVGPYGSIKYTLKAIAEISWARDLKEEVDLYVPFTFGMKAEPETESQSRTIEIDGITVLKVQTDTDHITLGDDLSFRFSVDRTAKIRGVRADIIRLENVEPKGHKMNTKRTIVEEYYPDAELTRDLWRAATIHTNPRWTPSFSSELITSEYFLKVTLDIPLRLDSVIEIPIVFTGPNSQNHVEFDL